MPAALAKTYPIKFCEWAGIFTLYLWAFSTFIPSINQVVLWGLIPISFLLCLRHYYNILANKYMILLLIIYLIYTAMLPMATHHEAAISSISRVWGTYIVCFISICLGQKRVTFNLSCGAWILMLLVLLWYAQTHITETLDIVHKRLQDGNLNANTFAYILLIVSYIVFYKGDNLQGRYQKWWKIGLIVLLPLSWYISLLAASRQVIVLIIPFIVLLLLRRYFRFTLRNIFITVVITAASIGAYLHWGAKLYEGSFLSQRMEIKVTEDARAQLVRESFEIISEHPLTGIGPDQFRFNSQEGVGAHNTFLELMDDSGVVNGFLYFILLWTFIRSNFIRWRRLHSDFFFAVTAYGVAFFIQNFFYIFFGAPQLIGFFFLIAAYSDNVWKSLRYVDNPAVLNTAEQLLITTSTGRMKKS